MVDFQFYRPSNRAVTCDQTSYSGLARRLGIGAVFVTLILAYAWLHNEILTIRYEMEQVKQENAQLSAINDSLRAEIRTMVNPQRIEKAAQQLGLIHSNSGEVLILEGQLPMVDPDKNLLADSRRTEKPLHE